MRDDNDSDGTFPPLYEAAALNTDVRNNIDTTDDGRVNINFDSKISEALRTLLHSPSSIDTCTQLSDPPAYSKGAAQWNISLNVVIQVVGSRGDVQPLIALGNGLQRAGHRVRIATHNVFEAFVKNAGLEFYPIGGDPAELMAYMVKNPGMIPCMATLRKGDIQKKRDMVSKILEGCWNSCIEPDIYSKKPFVAEAIIANPPSFAHIHCAQALGIPVHLIFTMPWTRTRDFPHPLANLQNMRNSTSEVEIAYLLSYDIVEWMVWQGLGDVINRWRKSLGLEAIDTAVGSALARELKIPFTYCWSPSLVPKPSDWPSYIDVCGFFFRDEPKYAPSVDLDAFLRSGPQPIYIGFGSIVINEPEKLTKTLLEAVEMCGVRAIISRGWSKLGGSTNSRHVFYLDDCPHEWLFKHVAAVVHHGGAGTTGCGLLNGCPTAIVPYFGDQPFWGEMLAATGAGPAPIPYKNLNSENLAHAIRYCLTPEASTAAKGIGSRMRKEEGVKNAVASFHRNLPLERLCCDVMPGLPAAWHYSNDKNSLKLSKEAAEILIKYGKVDEKNIKMYETKSINTDNRRWDPLTGSTSSLAGTATNMVSAAGGIFTAPYETYREARRQDTNNDERQKDSSKLASAMAMASVKSIGMFNLSLFKGTMVDLPLAVAEGLRTVPRLYGEEVQDHGVVTDWKSGFVVAGKSFVHGMYGFSDFVLKPYEGGRDEGALGFVKGVGTGTFGAASKPCSALLGLFAYPAQGLCKTVRSATHMGPRKRIIAARRSEGAYRLERSKDGGLDIDAVLVWFDEKSSRGEK